MGFNETELLFTILIGAILLVPLLVATAFGLRERNEERKNNVSRKN